MQDTGGYEEPERIDIIVTEPLDVEDNGKKLYTLYKVTTTVSGAPHAGLRGCSPCVQRRGRGYREAPRAALPVHGCRRVLAP